MSRRRRWSVVIDGVRQPRPDDRESFGRKGVWTAAQCAQFLTYVADDRHYAAWVLAVVCGMRRGEIAGLKWPKVNLDGNVIYVHWQRAVASGEVDGGVRCRTCETPLVPVVPDSPDVRCAVCVEPGTFSTRDRIGAVGAVRGCRRVVAGPAADGS
jgi:integrase